MVKSNFEMANWKSTMNSPFTRESLQAVQATPPRKLTPTDEAIMRGDLAPPKPATPALTTPAPSPLEAAGAAYAIALRAKRDAKLAFEEAQRVLAKTRELVDQRDADVEQARATLETLATGAE
jgi:hypothetical protein